MGARRPADPDSLVEAVGATRGDRALDLGCGNGASSRALAAAVGHEGSLVGIDVSAVMLEMARHSLDGALPEMTSLVVFFLPDAATAVARWFGCCGRGGRIGLSTFGPSSPQWQALEGHLRAFMPPGDPRMVGPQSPFASDAEVADLLTSAGAVSVQTSSRRVELTFAGFDQWVRFSRSVGQRVAWERMSDQDTSRVLEQARRTFDDSAAPDGTLRAWQEVRYTVGSAP